MNIHSILIVEDDINVSRLINSMLTGLGYFVAGIVESGAEALAITEKVKPDIILMDILLKGAMDGIDTAVLIHNKFDTPIIFLTALSDDKSFQRSKAAYPYGYIVKPFKLNDLRSVIHIAISKIEMSRKLLESELWFKTTLASISDGVIATDNNDNIRFMNKISELITGYSFNETDSISLNEVYKTEPDSTPEGLIYLSYEKSKNSSAFSLDYMILTHKNGYTIPIEQSISQIKDSENNILGNVISFRDISKKREKELDVLAAKDYYLNILEKFPVPIWRADRNGYFNYFNNKWLQYTGKSLSSQIFNEWYKYIHPDDRRIFENTFNHSLEYLNSFEVEFRLEGADGGYHCFLCAANPIYNLKGEFNGIVGVCFDITNRKAIEEELRKAKDLSDAASRAKSTFISNMSHEIRTPLNGIIGITELLKDTNTSRDQKEYLELISQASESLLGLLNNLLDFSKAEENKLEIKEYSFDIKQAVSEIVARYIPLAKRNGTALNFSIESEIPARLTGDGKKIQQIITNLLDNAVKFTSSGTITLNIERCIYSNGSSNLKYPVRFSVTDTGIGIDPGMHEKIFESFTQVDGSFTRRYSGTGLGLAVVKRMVNLMNGTIGVESTPGKGSCFYFLVEFKIN